jgi:gamma-glutamyltranspeptidase / glutathione hydrolase
LTTTRPTVRGFGGAVAAGHHLAAQIGARELASGGNAADAACAMGFALWVLEPTQNGPGGEVPILVRDARRERVFAISGQGPAPAAATIARVRKEGFDLLPPDGLVSACVPGALDSWCRLLEACGTRRLGDVIAPARALAERGFPMYPFLRDLVELIAPRFEHSWPTSAAIYLPLRANGERQTNAPLARWLAGLADAERAAGGSREAGIRAARDSFYRGAGAEVIDRFARIPVRDVSRELHAGLLTAADLASYAGAVEEPLSADYRGARVYKPGPWSQAPVFLQQLRLLEGFDLAALDPSGSEALHLWIETAKLAFADRDACYGDPRFTEVPLATLLSREYAAQRRALVDGEKASRELRPGLGRLPAGWPLIAEGDAPLAEPGAIAAQVARGEPKASEVQRTGGRTDTTQCVAVDTAGNAVSATPSGGWIMTSPVISGLGFPLGTRLQMASLDPDHPNALAPGKRPRTTLSPSLAQLADGRWLAFGTPGGDQQDQWTSQFFLRLAARGERDLQAAIDAPTVHSEHMPSSFYPRCARPGVVSAESRLDPAVLRALEARGHRIERKGPWEHGRVLAAAFDPSGGPQEAAASPRFAIAYAIALP